MTAVVSLPAAAAPPLDRLGFRSMGGGGGGTVNLMSCAAGPHLLFYGAVRRGPTSYQRAGAPLIRARERGGPSDPLGSEWVSERSIHQSPP
jgi:hypothetical protein